LSVVIQDSWTEVEVIPFKELNKLQPPPKSVLPVFEDLKSCGKLRYYDKTMENISSVKSKQLERSNATFFNVTTSDDPYIRQLAQNSEGNVFATDAILSLLMTCNRTYFCWDLEVTKTANELFFDYPKKKEGEVDYKFFYTVNENAIEPPTDDSKNPKSTQTALSKEATFINQNFSQQVLLPNEVYEFDDPNPFSNDPNVASIGYRYRRFRFNKNDEYTVVCRCEVDGVSETEKNDQLQFLTIRALNEWETTGQQAWKKKIDGQRSAVLSAEMKTNSAKLGRWCAQTILSGTDSIKIGFVTRTAKTDNSVHTILGVQNFSTKEFSTQINLDLLYSFELLEYIIDSCMEQENGKYSLLKNDKNELVLYQI